MKEYIKTTCKIGRGADCCRYLVMGIGGFRCAKLVPEDKADVDRSWETKDHVAQGDNCRGSKDFETEIE